MRVVVATLLATAVASLATVDVTTGPATPAVFAVVDGRVHRVDALSLGPLSKRGVAAPGFDGVWAQSPDGSHLALATRAGLRLIAATADPRRLGDVRVHGRSGPIAALVWPLPNRLFAVACCAAGRTSVLVVDVARRRLASFASLAGRLVATPVAVPAGLALLLAGEPLRLAIVDRNARTRTVALEGITGEPALAVDAATRSVYVAGGERATAIRLPTLGAAQHPVGPERRGATRTARWLAPDVLAVSGTDEAVVADEQGETHRVRKAAGLKLLHTRRWSLRVVDPRAAGVAVAAGRALAFAAVAMPSPRGGGASISGIGLRGYDRDGKRRFHLFASRAISRVQASGRYAYVQMTARPWLTVVDVTTGRITRTSVAGVGTTLLLP